MNRYTPTATVQRKHHFVLFGSRKYPYHPHGKDRIFQGGGGGVNLPNFPWGGGCTTGKYFQRVLTMRKRVTKKKQKFTTTIYLRRYKTQRKLKSY